MRFCRFSENRVGIVEGDTVRDVTDAVNNHLPPIKWPTPRGDQFMSHFEALRPLMEDAAKKAPALKIADLRLLSPVANPGKVVAAPVNYSAHLEEARSDEAISFGTHVATIDRAGVFLKATSSIIGAGETVIADWADRRIDHEVELALVIGKKGFRISQEDALDHVAGYMIGLDMTIRGPEERSYRKSLDTFTVLGPWVVTADEIENPNALSLRLTVNGQPRQDAHTSDLIFNVQKLIEYASKAYTLYPGDVILTGTPEGVGPVVPGDIIEASIESIGTMQVNVKDS